MALRTIVIRQLMERGSGGFNRLADGTGKFLNELQLLFHRPLHYFRFDLFVGHAFPFGVVTAKLLSSTALARVVPRHDSAALPAEMLPDYPPLFR